MATDTRTKTLREAIEAGERGKFAQVLHELWRWWPMREDDYACALLYANEADGRVLREAFQQALITDAPDDVFRSLLKTRFPFLAHLDEPASDWLELGGASDAH
jgi:hypothetical protein